MSSLKNFWLPRRAFLRSATGVVLGALGGRSLASAHDESEPPAAGHAPRAADHGANDVTAAETGYLPVQTLDVPKLPFELDRGVKVFRLVAEHVKREFLPGKVFDVWGYSGSMPGPTIEVVQGDRVRILFENRLPEPTTVHWHGLEVPIGMDGVPAISQPEVEPGGQFTYEFTLHQHGTFFYHSHGAMQEMLGMLGLFIIHPRKPYRPPVQKDFGIVLQEWAVLPNNTIPNTLSMEFNWLTFNGKAGPAATPMLVRLGERVRIRMVNIGMDHHPIHLHGHQFYLTGTEGGRIPEALWYPENTVLVGVAQARVIEFEAKYPGDWMFHCHLPHHMMNQMVSMVGPIAHAGHGTQTGGGMEEGMGMVRQGSALSDDLGPKFGRGMGMAETERRISNLAGPRPTVAAQGHGEHGAPTAVGAKKRVPGFPQDMFMVMDDEVAKPETYGLAPGWSGAMQGMMTVVRVLPDDKYEDIMRRVREGRVEGPRRTPDQPASPGPGHRH
jgi:FtsP/CotA-like multicopper oxidase with cupredoxin domain